MRIIQASPSQRNTRVLTSKISHMSFDVVRTGSMSRSESILISAVPSVSRIQSCTALNSPSLVITIRFLLSSFGRCMYTCCMVFLINKKHGRCQAKIGCLSWKDNSTGETNLSVLPNFNTGVAHFTLLELVSFWNVHYLFHPLYLALSAQAWQITLPYGKMYLPYSTIYMTSSKLKENKLPSAVDRLLIASCAAQKKLYLGNFGNTLQRHVGQHVCLDIPQEHVIFHFVGLFFCVVLSLLLLTK